MKNERPRQCRLRLEKTAANKAGDTIREPSARMIGHVENCWPDGLNLLGSDVIMRSAFRRIGALYGLRSLEEKLVLVFLDRTSKGRNKPILGFASE